MMVGRTLAAALVASLIAGQAVAQDSARARFAAIMDNAFGAGAWRITGGFRTPERENQLRRQGAMTVRAGGLSRHSLGTPDAPGAYDIVVDGMSPYEAADRLRAAGAPFARYMPKGAHGSQGPHLHLEPWSFDLQASGGTPIFTQTRYAAAPRRPRAATNWDTGGLMVVEGIGHKRVAPDPAPAAAPEPAPEPVASAEDAFAKLRKAAMHDDAQAQLDLGRAYLAGEITKRDVKAAMKWIDLATSNPKADDKLRAEAASAIDDAANGLESDYARKTRLARQGD